MENRITESSLSNINCVAQTRFNFAVGGFLIIAGGFFGLSDAKKKGKEKKSGGEETRPEHLRSLQ